MDFKEAVRLMNTGSTVKVVEGDAHLLGETFVMASGVIKHSDLSSDGDIVELVGCTFEEVVEQPKLYAVFKEDKGRWVSTTNPDRHRSEGKQVAVFELKQAL